MTTAEYFGAERPAAHGAAAALMAAARSAIGLVGRYRRMRRALHELNRLDDRMLKDIGLSRSTLNASALDVHGFGGLGHGGR